MLLCGKDSSKGFRNWKAYPHQRRLYGEPPNHTDYPYRLGSFLEALNCAYQYARAWFVYTHTFRQTLPMLVQQCFRENRQPYYTSIQDSRMRIIAPMREMSRYMARGRIGVWSGLESYFTRWVE